MEDNSRSLIEHFDKIKDPRIERKKLHKLIDIIIIAICAVVSGANGFDAIEIFGKAHKEWFKKYLELPNGIPSHDTFERVLCRLDPIEFRRCFANWTKDLAGIFTDVIAIDGQTHRGARNKGQLKSPIHMVSAWATGLRLVLAQVKVDEKSNEITAIPEVLKILDIHGCIITMDAMGCQQKIADQIIKQGGDYVLGLKGNQGTTFDAAKDHFATAPENTLKKFCDVDKGHGRIEIREYFAAEANSILNLKEWPGLKSVIKVISTREINDVSTTEERFYLSSIDANSIKKIGQSIRSHWGVENSLHYTLDVTFNQDKSRIRTGNGAENMGILRHIAVNILKNAPNAKKSSPSNNLKRMRAAMDNDYLTEIMKSAGLDK